MAMPKFMLQIFSEVNKLVPGINGEKKLISLGYPDLLVNIDHIRELFGNVIASNIIFHPNSESIIKWHNIQDIAKQVPESHHFFSLLGYQLDIVDIVKARGDEIILDLNEPVSPQYTAQYDVLIDAGTIEHCFNIAQAIKNLAMMVRQDGFIIQSNPLNWFNHGFYNLNPTFYYDFYETNGFEIIWFSGANNVVHDAKTFELPKYGRFDGVPTNTNNFIVAKRVEIKPITWPVQYKYRKNPHLQG